MNSIEDFLEQQQARKKWSVRQTLQRVIVRMRRMLKRRLRGESRRQWIERNLKDSEAGIVFDLVQCTVSLLMVYSVMAQNWHAPSYAQTDSQLHKAIDLINLGAITIAFGLRFYAASNRKAFCLHWLSIIDFWCWAPLLVEVVVPDDGTRSSKYEYRFFLMIRALRLLQVFRLRRLAKSAKARQSMLIGMIAICIIICAAAAFQTIEYCDGSAPNQIPGFNCQNLSFFDSIYFVCITIGTVGYGEFAPKTKVGKIADICLIIFTGVLIPTQISVLTEILSRETVFDKKYRPDKRIQHILLCGDIDNSSLNFFLHTWLQSDGERKNLRKIIILSPSLPSSSVRRVLIHREYEQRVLYLQGSAMDANDLQRAGAPTASYCFVMVDKHSNSLDEDDTATNLVTCSIRKTNRQAPLYVQVSKVDNVRHINISGASAVVCLEQLKLSIFAKSLWIKGLNAFLGNLVQRYDQMDEKGGFWLKEYMATCSNRIYEAAIPSFLFMMPTFQSLAVLLYREFGAPLIGIRTLQETVLVYPIDKEINEIGFHSVFFLAKCRDTITKIEKLTNAVFARHPDISPNLDVSSGKSNRMISNVLNSMSVAALDTLNPFQRLSIARGTERHGSTVSVSRLASTGRPTGRGTARGNDKITPVDQDDGVGDSSGPERSEPPPQPRLMKKGTAVMIKSHARHPSSVRDQDYDGNVVKSEADPLDPPYVPYAVPIIAMSPAELLKKAASPLPASARPVITPRSARPTSPRRNENETSQKPSSAGAVNPRSEPIFTPSLVPNSNNGPTSPTANSRSSIPKRPAENIEPASGPSGPCVSAIEAAQDPSREPSMLSQDDDRADGDDVSYLLRTSKDGPPVIRRTASNKRVPHRLSRSSKYRSFRRRVPPKNLSGHFVVCGIPTSYSLFMASLHDLDVPNPTVVFVTPRDLSEKDFSTYIQFKEVYFVRGSPVNMETFEEARMLHARSVLIMSFCGQEKGDETTTSGGQIDENMADVDAITTHRFISEAYQNNSKRTASVEKVARSPRSSWLLNQSIPYIVIEMNRPSNVKFLVDRSGSLYDENSAVNEVRTREALREVHALDDALFSPLYAGGHVYFSNFMDAVLGSSSQNAFLIDMITQPDSRACTLP